MVARVFLLALLTLLFGAAGLQAGSSGPGPKAPEFVEETGQSGIDSVYDGDWEFTVGGGVAAFDCNNDGFADLVLAGGKAPAKFYRNVSSKGGPLRFEPHQSGLELDNVTGAYPLDVNGDGFTDIALLRVGENLLMRGRGGCYFEPANELWGFQGGDGWSTALAATWERGAEWPTIAVGNYVDRREETSPWGSCTDNWLHRPARHHPGLKTVRRPALFLAPVALTPSYCPLSMLFTDWDRSGMPSLRVSNDREYYEGGQEQMWRLLPDKAPELFAAKDGWKPLKIWGMGIASYDLDADGYPEYFLTSMADNKLQSLAGDPKSGRPRPVYKDIAYARGVTAHRPYIGEDLKPSTAWHTQFEDVNNDGLVDLFIAKGNVAKMPDFAARDPNNLLLQAPDGRFEEAGAVSGVGSGAISRGAALADFNLDGALDLVVVNRWEKAQIWRNANAGPGSWVEVQLLQPGANREAVGAWVEVRDGDWSARREITVGGGHVSGQSGWRHFGLGDRMTVEMRVLWPDGGAGEWQRLAANSFYILERDKPARAWSPQ